MHDDIAYVLLSEDEIRKRVQEIGREITTLYAGKELVLIGILKGAVIFMSDLLRYIDIPVTMDFMAVSSYGASTHSTGVVRILKDLDFGIEGKHVILVEDIVDTGLTLHYLQETLLARNPVSFQTCALLDKPSRRKKEVKVDYRGFEIPDAFVVGYGLDYNEHYRNLPYICVLKEEVYNGKMKEA